MPNNKLWMAACAIPVGLAACATDPDPDPALADDVAALTSIIPTSTSCNQGLGPKQCVQVVPVEVSSTSAWTVDGARGPGEYIGATELPFTTDTGKATSTFSTTPLRGHGRIYVQRAALSTGVIRDYLYVLLEDLVLPVYGSNVQSKVAVHLDHGRFDGADGTVTSEDVRYLIDLAAGGAVVVQRPQILNGQPVWMNSSGLVVGLAYTAGGCKLAGDGTFARCRGELRIPLPSSAVTPPAAGLDPGVGFFVRSTTVTEASAPQLPAGLYATSQVTRTSWPTLLFAKPRGFDLSIMSWNVRRFESLFETQDFGDVSPAAIGKYLARHDIVAIQEGWDRDQVTAIVDAANAQRAALDLPKFHLYGPIDFEPSWSEIITTLVDLGSDTHGGLWVMSHLPLAASSYAVFPQDACRGEDCFKAKGVQWVRLMMQDPASLSKECAANKAKGCDKLPSGDDYIDIFNTHLQASKPLMCTLEDDWSALKTAILAAVGTVAPYLAIVAGVLIELVENDLNCNTISDREVRSRQLAIMNRFIEASIGRKPDRPSLVMGDFNIDGKRIHDPLLGDEYRKMLVALDITSNGFDDAISPTAGDWDVEHGDLARELDTIYFASGICLGTSIGETDGWRNDGCPMSGKSDGEERLDYILVRPPQRVEDVTDYPRWYAVPGKTPWSSPFPSATGAFAYEPPARLSDHKPIVSSLTFARLSNPPAYNPTWPHDVELRVMSLDATGYDDCIGCGEIDPYAHLKRTIAPSGASSSRTTSECTGRQAPSYGDDACMNNWYLTAKHTPPNDDSVQLSARIREDDDTSDDDTIDEGTWVRFVYGTDGVGELRAGHVLFGQDLEDPPWPIYELAPMPRCAGVFATVCYRITLTERPPGK